MHCASKARIQTHKPQHLKDLTSKSSTSVFKGVDSMKITERKHMEAYKRSIGNKIPAIIKNFDFSEDRGGFDYLTKSSAVYSSYIEGNSIDLNSYMN